MTTTSETARKIGSELDEDDILGVIDASERPDGLPPSFPQRTAGRVVYNYLLNSKPRAFIIEDSTIVSESNVMFSDAEVEDSVGRLRREVGSPSTETERQLLKQIDFVSEPTDYASRSLVFGFQVEEGSSLEADWIVGNVIYRQPTSDRIIGDTLYDMEGFGEFIPTFFEKGGEFLVYQPGPSRQCQAAAGLDVALTDIIQN